MGIEIIDFVTLLAMMISKKNTTRSTRIRFTKQCKVIVSITRRHEDDHKRELYLVKLQMVFLSCWSGEGVRLIEYTAVGTHSLQNLRGRSA